MKHPQPTGRVPKPVMMTKRQLMEALENDPSEMDEPVAIYLNDGGLVSYRTLAAVSVCANSRMGDDPQDEPDSFSSLVLEAGDVTSVG